MAAYDVAVEARHGALALLEQHVVQRPGDRGLAAAGQAGEEHDQTLAVGRREVALHHGGDVVGQVALAGHPDDRAGRVGLDHALAERVVDLGVAVAGQGYGDHGGVRELPGGQQRGADERGRGEQRGAGADQRQQQDVSLAGRLLDPVEVGVGECVGDRHGERAVVVLLAHLGRGEVEPPERTVLRVRERRDLAAGNGHPGQRQPLRVDQLDGAGRLRGGAHVDRQAERDRAAGLVEAGQRGQRPRHEQLEVVELGRRGAVLGHGLVGHRNSLPHRVHA